MLSYLSLKSKILIVTLPFAIISLVIIAFVGYLQTYGIVENQLSDNMISKVSEAANTINLWFDGHLAEAEEMAVSPDVKRAIAIKPSLDMYEKGPQYDILDNLIMSRHEFFKKRYPGMFNAAYYGDLNGNISASSLLTPEGKPRRLMGALNIDDGYWEALKSGKPMYGRPFVSPSTGKPCISAHAPIKDTNNRVIGAMSTSMSVGTISEMMKKLSYGERGYTILLYRDGTYIHHPDQRYIMNKKITDDPDPSMQELGKRMLSDQSGVVSFIKDGQNLIAFYHRVSTPNFVMASIVAENELFSSYRKLIKVALAVSASALFITFIMNQIVMWKTK